MNFKNWGDAPQGDDVDIKFPGGVQLVRQPSIYSLTFDEFQNTLGGVGKDYGSMNMDELLKNIWNAEETQATASLPGGGHCSAPGGDLQRQGSLSLPRTLSQKTVDEVWRDLIKECASAKDVNGYGGSNVPQRQPTLGEMTLEEFLVRAGVVREDTQEFGKPNNNEFFGDLSQPNSSSSVLLEFQQPNQGKGILNNRTVGGTNSVLSQPSSLAMNTGGVNPTQLQFQRHHHQKQPPVFPKPTSAAFTSPVNNAQISTSCPRRGIVGTADHTVNTGLAQGSVLHGGGLGMVNVATSNVTVAAVSPANHIASDVTANNGQDSPSLSPVPYTFNRGRKSNAIEKVVERRQRRMIKNRESAARSRARKQAYTLELEAEVAKLKEINQELQKKQEEMLQMQKTQVFESVNRQWGSKRLSLRRTLTGPW